MENEIEIKSPHRMPRMIKGIAKFVLVLVAMTVVSTIIWQFIGDGLYDCTDDNMLGFFRPGGWVHDWNGHGIAVVQKVIHGRSMSEPDTIKQGWSITRLWYLWFSFVGASLVISGVLAWVPWSPQRRN